MCCFRICRSIVFATASFTVLRDARTILQIQVKTLITFNALVRLRYLYVFDICIQEFNLLPSLFV
jgi:hypothetical protein